ncbi:hypothetical protein [Cupriavidus necator]
MPRQRKEYSESTAQIIDAEVRTILGDASQRVKQTLLANRHKPDALAKLLLEQEVVDRPSLELLLNEKVIPLSPGKPHPFPPDAPDSREVNHENEDK